MRLTRIYLNNSLLRKRQLNQLYPPQKEKVNKIATIKQLIEDLENLNKDYLKMSRWIYSRTKENVRKQEEGYLKSGELFINFYNNKFVPEYSSSKEIPIEVLNKVENFFLISLLLPLDPSKKRCFLD